MAKLTEFKGINEGELNAKEALLKECIAQNSASQNCSECQRVFNCDKIKEFVALQFDIAIAKLRQCQASNNRTSCMDCGDFFECKIRSNYVDATYEKMNEGRGGQFDF